MWWDSGHFPAGLLIDDDESPAGDVSSCSWADSGPVRQTRDRVGLDSVSQSAVVNRVVSLLHCRHATVSVNLDTSQSSVPIVTVVSSDTSYIKTNYCISVSVLHCNVNIERECSVTGSPRDVIS